MQIFSVCDEFNDQNLAILLWESNSCHDRIHARRKAHGEAWGRWPLAGKRLIEHTGLHPCQILELARLPEIHQNKQIFKK